MNLSGRSLLASVALALCACGNDPVLTDRDGGVTPEVDAHVPVIDGGRGDAGPPPIDGGPECANRDPIFPENPAAGEWQPGFANPGVGGDLPNVEAIAFGADGEVYLGGEFSTAGYAPAVNVARWDGETGWSALGAGLPGRVRSLAVASDGDLLAAHAVDESTYLATLISRWDGAAWTQVAASVESIEELAFVGTTLFAVGSFTEIGGVVTAGIARWDGTTWTGYAGIAPDYAVKAISAVSLDDVCIGGEFRTLGIIPAIGAACWNGTEWQSRTLPLPDYRGIFDLQRDPADGSLVASGDFMLESPSERGGSVARWVVDHWEPIGGGVMSEFGPGSTKMVRGLAFVPSGMYAGGAFRLINPEDPQPVAAVARWDGTTWDDIGGVFAEVGFGIETERVYMVGAGPDGSVYFGGLFTRSDSLTVAHVVRYDGTYWSALRTPGERYEGVAGAVSALEREGACAVYVGGNFQYAGAVRVNNVARYTAEGGYQALGEGVVGGVQTIEVLGGGRIVAGGNFTDETGTVFANVALWDGSTWRALGGSVDAAVSALESAPSVSPDAPELIYVGGDFTNAGEVPAENLAMWDGERWTEIGGGFHGHPYEWDPESEASTSVRAILRDPATGDLIVAGQFLSVGPDELVVNNIARWDGEQWHAYGSGLGDLAGSPQALTFWNDRLVAVGDFSQDGDGALGPVVVWNGTAWESVGTLELQPYSHVYTVEAVGDVLYVGGAFRLVGSDAAHVAVYDGTTWSPLGEGASDLVQALVAMDEGVYVGGSFDRTGTSPSVGLSLWQFAQ